MATPTAARSQEDLRVNAIRALAIDMVEQARAGHPGAPMGAAALAYALWDRWLRHNPADPDWPNRDRFVLSAGHASALLYALLHLTGYDLPMEELQRFRQLGSRTPGHPEHGLTAGVETTTGPLGQGFGNAVGMAMAERWLAATFNRPGHAVVDHRTYVLASDGDLQEGVTSEAASLAGTLGLGKLTVLYDSNHITIEGEAQIAFTEDVGARFRAYGWHVAGPLDGLDTDAVDAALREAEAEPDRPTLIICETIIGYGSPNKAGTGKAHGEPLGTEEARLAKERLGWTSDPFTVPAEALAHFRAARERGQRMQADWEARFAAFQSAHPKAAAQLSSCLAGALPDGWSDQLRELFTDDERPVAIRDASQRVMNAVAERVPNLIGGSADLAPSTRTLLRDAGDFTAATPAGRNLHFGIREHAMGAIANGMALHGGVIPYTATFLAFYDYMRPPVRLAALMGARVVFVFSHDSVAVGEDGPTHQPIEQLMGLRAVPNLVMIRPADGPETAESWRLALERTDGPTVLVTTRQGLPILDRNACAGAEGLRRGAYVLWESGVAPDVLLIATGSEVHLALQAGIALADRGVHPRVVSMPSWELFDRQPQAYRDAVLPPGTRARVAAEAGTPMGWERYVGTQGTAIGMTGYGASGSAPTLMHHFGFTVEAIVEAALRQLRGVV